MGDPAANLHPWNQTLWQQLTTESDRRSHALLLTGHKGLGKLDFGFALAQHVIGDNHSQSATLFQAGSHPDMHMLMPEAELVELEEDDLKAVFSRRYQESHSGKPRRNITIDQVRKLSEALSTHPHISKTRVILIAFAESLNRNAANALLKNLEEPPGQTLFILISDEVSLITATIRSRCSLVPMRTPTTSVGRDWLTQHGSVPVEEIDQYLAMANGQPLAAIELYKSGYIDTLKAVFTDVNGLWSHKRQVVEAAKHWQDIDAATCVEVLQKLCVDLLRCKLSPEPQQVFFPVQLSWIQSSSTKLSTTALLDALDELSEARRLLRTTVDRLLVLETLAGKIQAMPG